jgi:glyoxylase-like metal-dependent hydrolase (beta-lactamase superfamily II)
MASVHHLNCATLCPIAQRWSTGEGRVFGRGRLVCHCLLVETPKDGLVLVDTGFGTHDLEDRGRFHGAFRWMTAPAFDPREPAIMQVKALGFRPEDVRHIVLTHMDLDHAGGLADFPWAKVHVHGFEHSAATLQKTRAEQLRYVAAQWAHGPQWVLYEDTGDEWLGLKAIRPLKGLEGVFLVPLFGHSKGHSGVVVETESRALLHAGDAFFFHGEIEEPPRCPLLLKWFQSIVGVDKRARHENAARLRELHQSSADKVEIFCAHDPVQLELLKQRSSLGVRG